jgi:hypothetical protein
LQIITEGHADTVLMEILRVPYRLINKSGGGKSQVAKAMETQSNKDFNKFLIGIIDADTENTNKTRYFDDFTKIKSDTENRTTLYKKNNQYIIELCCPAIERWLLDSADSLGLDLDTFGLSKDIKQFKKVTKSLGILKNNDFKNFIRELNSRSAPAFVYLNELLNELFEQAGVTRY